MILSIGGMVELSHTKYQHSLPSSTGSYRWGMLAHRIRLAPNYMGQILRRLDWTKRAVLGVYPSSCVITLVDRHCLEVERSVPSPAGLIVCSIKIIRSSAKSHKEEIILYGPGRSRGLLPGPPFLLLNNHERRVYTWFCSGWLHNLH